LHELETILHQEIDRLPAKYLAPFVLCCLEGKSRADAAQQLDLPEGTVSGRIAKARALLESRLARQGITLSAALGAVAVGSNASAAVPGVLSAIVIRAAVAFAAGKTCDVGSSQAVILAEGVIRAMFISKAKVVTSVLLAMVLAFGGAGLLYSAWLPQAGDPPRLAVVLPEKPDQDKVPPAGEPALPRQEDPSKLILKNVAGMWEGEKAGIKISLSVEEANATMFASWEQPAPPTRIGSSLVGVEDGKTGTINLRLDLLGEKEGTVRHVILGRLERSKDGSLKLSIVHNDEIPPVEDLKLTRVIKKETFEALKKVGAHIDFVGAHVNINFDDKKPGKPGIGVDFRNNEAKLNDEDLSHFSEFKALQSLNLTHSQVTDEGLKQLRDLKNLQILALSNTKVTDAGLKHLRDLKELRRLCLGSTQVTDKGLKDLRELRNMHTLDLSHTKVTDEGLKELRASKELRYLGLASTQVTDIGMKELGERKALQELDLSGTKVTDGGFQHLRELKDLSSLRLVESKITDKGLRHLRELGNLQLLAINGTAITDEGLKEIRSLKNLTTLELSFTQVTDTGLKELLDLSKLTALHLRFTKVSDVGLMDLGGVRGLQLITLTGTEVTEEGAEKLRKALPKCEVQLQ
jgi:Leucine-rich repeat (LRR) protein